MVRGDGGMGTAKFDLPPLEDGDYWLVTSGDPRGAESPGCCLYRRARPFRVAGSDASVECSLEAAITATSGAPVQIDGWLLDGDSAGATSRMTVANGRESSWRLGPSRSRPSSRHF